VLNESALPRFYLEMPLPDGSTLTADDTIVLFLNDIVFLPTDMTKLLETNYARSRRLVHYNKRWQQQNRHRTSNAAAEQQNNDAEEPILTTERGFSSLWDGFNMACGMDFYVSFYDQWVTRDYDGRRFDSYPPYARDFGSQQIFYEAESLRSSSSAHHINDHQPRHTAAPARCCWNGAAAIRSSMFLRHDIRFRMPVSNMFNMSRGSACYSSECMLICKDIIQAATCERKAEEMELRSTGGKKSLRDQLEVDCPVFAEQSPKKRRKSAVGSSIVLAPDTSEDTWVDVGGIFVNPHVKVAYDDKHFALHHEQWFVSSVWFYRVVSFLRVGTWLLPDAFEPPGGDAQPTWLECVLPDDVVPVLTLVWTFFTGTTAGWCCVVLTVFGFIGYSVMQTGNHSSSHRLVGHVAVLIDRIGRAIPCHSIRLLFRRCTVAFARRANNSSASGSNLRMDDSDDGRVVVGYGVASSSPISPNTATTPSSIGGGFGSLVTRRSATSSA
jgi:hypothetical protein